VPVLRLRVYRDRERVEAAVAAAQARVPADWPCPVLFGGRVECPGLPEVVEALYQEFLARRLRTLAGRLVDPVRWR
jgi:hypothetical protein